jgi:hypothetical protein
MNAEDLSFNNSSNAKIVEDFSAVFPWVGVSVLSYSLIIETIDGSDLSGLVVSSKKGDM